MTLRNHLKNFPVKTETTYGTNPTMPNPLDSLPWITDREPTEADALDGSVQVLFERTDKSKLIGTCDWTDAVPRSKTEFGYYIHGWLHCPDWRPPAPKLDSESPAAAEILINALAAIDTPLTEKQIHAVRYFVSQNGLKISFCELKTEPSGTPQPIEYVPEESPGPKANALASAIQSAIAEGILAAKRPGGPL